ncbi:uncharacterized protein LOC117607556 [Osmia lignaria lignaria]|uniref:uncharacterized protein LOC117607556 n=1 Tax=Osmia lignaria lignaria TaxID=1437193 RepID=UPI001479320D|nr:uncharacterized protein LOC117607556 [Osmia lignaria]XP_034187269.1 uncharacterized protein LOC117607556 [Osmia lignaria]XP_034187270.1 uncharacterized protein LOC117607556 [Osmia lignaria]
MERKQGQTIRSEARNIIRRVIKKCDEEARKGAMIYLLKQANLRASFYTGTCIRTISRIRKEDSTYREDEPLPTPGTKRPKREDKKFRCSLEDQAVIRGVIYDFYLEKKIMPTGPKILAAIREKIDFPWEIHSLYRLLQRMGFEWKKTNSIKKVLIEKPNFIAWRAKYLKAIEYYRKQNRPIIYIDETWVDNTLYFHKCWDGKEIGIMKNTNSSNRLVIIHAGGKDGFIKGGELIFESQTTPSDIHGQMNAANFEIWITEKLLPNIPPNSVVVMDNAPYHSARLNKPPSNYSKKEDILRWLVENNIPYAQNMRKYQLLELVDRHKKLKKTFKVDEILKVHGHNALRLPPSMSDLNPIELAWSQVKKKLREKKIFVSSSSELERYIMEAINEVTQKDWKNFCEHVEKLEGDYWRKDGLVEEITDNLELPSDESESDSDESTDPED